MPKYFCMSVAAVVLALVAAVSAQDYQVIPVRNGGTINGTVKWSGPMPHLIPFVINKDPLICDPNSQKTRDLERLIVGSQGGVANTVVFLKDISHGKAMDLAAAAVSRPKTLPLRAAHSVGPVQCVTADEKFRRHAAHHPYGRGRHLQSAFSFYKPGHYS